MMEVLTPIEDSGGDAKCVVDVVTQLRQVDEDIKNMICNSVNKMDQERNSCDERIKSLDALVDAKEDELLFLASKLSEMEDDLETKKGKIELLATKYTNIENELILYKEKLQLAENKNEEIMEKIEKMGSEELEQKTDKLLVVEKENEENKKTIVLLQEQLIEKEQNVRTNNDTSFIEHRLAEKLYTLQNENKHLKDTVLILSQDILDKNKVTDESDKEGLIKSLQATEALMQLQKTNCQKAEILASALTLKLELEHDRRVRAQSVIDDLEKEKAIRRGEMQKKVAECGQKDQQIAELILGGDFKEDKMNKNLESVIEEKNAEILRTQERANELALKSEEFEEYFMNQTEVAITLQSELQTSYEENKSLKKEMEMLNEMFEQMEHSIKVKEALDGQGYNSNEMVIYQDGKKVNVKVNELLELAALENQDKIVQESCFNQVTTKNGTRMIVSVGKTFVKLRGLILEKKTLEEQLDQMKNINEHLCTHVNNHEQKLCNITEELNNTWFYVDKIKEQTKMLHNSETILRAELAEKRGLLSKLRKELEESRASWNQVKLKNEDSERQWKSLKEDFAERRRMIWTPPASSESGFSEADTEALTNQSEGDNGDPPVTIPIDVENIDPLSLPVGTPEVVIASGIGAEFDDDDDDESIPDPFSDDEDDMIYVDAYANNMISSTTTITNDMQNDLDEDDDEEDYSEETIPLFIPSASYMSQIPTDLQAPLFPTRKEQTEYQEVADREGIDFTALNHCDDNVKDLISRMMCTSARSAFLATSLADLQRRITGGGHLISVSDDDVDTDEEPRITEDDTGEDDTESIEIESELGDLETPPGGSIPPPPPLPSFSLLPPISHLTVRPTYENGSSDDDDDDEDDGRRRNVTSPESSTAVTRFLIKHLPKQLSQLRNEKAVLEEKVRDLEALNMEQRTRMGEHERRAEAEKTKANKLEDILSKEKEVPGLGDQEVPVCVEEAGVLLTWTITSSRGEEPSFIVFFSSKDGSETEEVPPLSTEVIPPTDQTETIQTVLLTSCRNAGTYTLHVRGTTHGAPNVTLGFQMEKKSTGS